MRIAFKPFYPLIVWTFAIAAVVQVYKKVVKVAGVRHSTVVEATLPFVPVVVGVLSGMAFSDLLGLQAVTTDTADGVPWTLAAFYGSGAGFASTWVFSAVRAFLPKGSRLRRALTVCEQE
jgi:hypothetical protein